MLNPKSYDGARVLEASGRPILDKGAALPRSEIEARILKELYRRIDKDTCVAWVKCHKGIEGIEEADKLCRETSIVGTSRRG